MDELSDADLADRVRGDAGRAAFRALYDRHAADLLAVLTARYPADAEDIAQTAWLRVFAALGEGPRAMPNFRSWLFTIATNVGRDLRRKRRPERLADRSEMADPEFGPREALEDSERRAAVADCYGRLRADRPDYADVIAAVSAGELPADAAAQIGISRENFDKRKQRAIALLRACLGETVT